MSDIKIVAPEPVEEPREFTEPAGIQQDGVMLLEQVGKGLFDFNPSEISSYKDKLEVLIDYAKTKTDDHSPDGIKWALRHLGMKLGTPPLGEKLINYLHIYCKLHMQGKRIEEEKQKFLRGEQD